MLLLQKVVTAGCDNCTSKPNAVALPVLCAVCFCVEGAFAWSGTMNRIIVVCLTDFGEDVWLCPRCVTLAMMCDFGRDAWLWPRCVTLVKMCDFGSRCVTLVKMWICVTLPCYGLRGEIFAKNKRVSNAKRAATASWFTQNAHAMCFTTVSIWIVIIYTAGSTFVSLLRRLDLQFSVNSVLCALLLPCVAKAAAGCCFGGLQ